MIRTGRWTAERMAWIMGGAWHWRRRGFSDRRDGLCWKWATARRNLCARYLSSKCGLWKRLRRTTLTARESWLRDDWTRARMNRARRRRGQRDGKRVTSDRQGEFLALAQQVCGTGQDFRG